MYIFLFFSIYFIILKLNYSILLFKCVVLKIFINKFWEKMVYITCLAHELYWVAEEIQKISQNLIVWYQMLHKFF